MIIEITIIEENLPLNDIGISLNEFNFLDYQEFTKNDSIFISTNSILVYQVILNNRGIGIFFNPSIF